MARDVVRHLVEWFPPFLHDGAGIDLPAGPSVDEDPVAAWQTMSDGVQSVLDHPTTAQVTFEHGRAGTHPLDRAIDMFFLGDVLIHTWDLARATGQDETLDADEVHGMLVGIEPYDEVLRSSGQYGARVAVPDVPTSRPSSSRSSDASRSYGGGRCSRSRNARPRGDSR